MMMDLNLQASIAQVLSGAGTTPSTNIIPLGAARNLGTGKKVTPTLNVSGVTGTNPTLVATLQGADDNAMSVNVIPICVISLTAAQMAAILASPSGQMNVHGAIASHTPKAFLNWSYVVGGTSTPGCTVTSDFVIDEQSTPAPPYT